MLSAVTTNNFKALFLQCWPPKFSDKHKFEFQILINLKSICEFIVISALICWWGSDWTKYCAQADRGPHVIDNHVSNIIDNLGLFCLFWEYTLFELYKWIEARVHAFEFWQADWSSNFKHDMTVIKQVKTPIFKIVVPAVLIVLAPSKYSLFSFPGKFYSMSCISQMKTKKCLFGLLTLKLHQIQLQLSLEWNQTEVLLQ